MQKMSNIQEYSPYFEDISKNTNISVRDNSIEIINEGNTFVWCGKKKLEPNGGFIRTPFTKPENVCVWDFYLKFGEENVTGDGAEPLKKVAITRTNFHNKAVSNYKS